MLGALLKANAGNEADLLKQLQALQAGGAPAAQVQAAIIGIRRTLHSLAHDKHVLIREDDWYVVHAPARII